MRTDRTSTTAVNVIAIPAQHQLPLPGQSLLSEELFSLPNRAGLAPTTRASSVAQGISTQADLVHHLRFLVDAAKGNNWSQLSSALNQLMQLAQPEILSTIKTSIAVGEFQSVLHLTAAKSLDGPIRLKFYQVFSAYCFAFLRENQIVAESEKNLWLTQIDNLLTEIGTAGQTKDNLPYLHADTYYLTCARAAVQLMSDTHKVDWIKHATNLVTVAGGFFKVCESKGGELAKDFFDWVMAKLSDQSTTAWYEKVLLLTVCQSQIMGAETLTPKSRRAMLEIQRVLTAEVATKFPSWQVVYACIEGLESGLLKMQGDDPAWELVIKGGGDPDPKYAGNHLTRLEELQIYHPTFSRGNRWCVRARFIQLAITLQRKKNHFSLTGWANILLGRLTELSTAYKRTGNTAPKEFVLLDNRPKEWSQYFSVIKENWTEHQTQLESAVGVIGVQLQEIEAHIASGTATSVEAAELRDDLKQLNTMLSMNLEIRQRADKMMAEIHAGVNELLELNRRPEINIQNLLNRLRDYYKTSGISKIELYSGRKIPTEKALIHLAIIPNGHQPNESFEDLCITKPAIDLARIFVGDTDEPNFKRLLVLGRAGIGKSTLCQYIAHQWASGRLWPNYKAVFWIKLRNINESSYRSISPEIYSWIDIVNRECFGGIALTQEERRALEAYLEKNKNQFLFLLDGYDELSENEKNKAKEKDSYLIPALKQLCSKAHCLITSRPDQVVEIEADRYMEITGFTPDDIEEYIQLFFMSTAKNEREREQALHKAKILHGYLKTQPSIRAIARIPLLLSFICRLDGNDKLKRGAEQLTLSTLYRQLAEDIFRSYFKRSGQTFQESFLKEKYAHLQAIFERLAYDLTLDEKNRVVLTADQLNSVIKFCYPTLNIMIRDAYFNECVTCGLLHPIPDSDQYEFTHLTFQEYFAAGAIASMIKKGGADFEMIQKIILTHRFEPRLQLMWWFTAGHLAKDIASLEKFFEILMQRDFAVSIRTFFTKPKGFLEVNERRLLLACLAECGEPRLQVTRDLFLCVLINDLAEQRPTALKIFGRPQLGSEVTIQVVCEKLRDALRHPDSDAKCYAIKRLENLAPPTFVLTISEVLYTMAMEDPSNEVRLIAGDAIAKMAAVATKAMFFKRLLEVILNSEDELVRITGMHLLRKLGNIELKQSVCERLLNIFDDHREGVKRAGIDMLRKFDPSLSPVARTPEMLALIEACENYHSSGYDAKTTAVKELGELLEAVSLNIIAANRVLKYVTPHLDNSNNPLFTAAFFKPSTVKRIFKKSADVLAGASAAPQPAVVQHG